MVKPVFRGHLWDKENVVFYDMWPLKRGSIHIKFSMTGPRLEKGDLLIEVTVWAGLTVFIKSNLCYRNYIIIY